MKTPTPNGGVMMLMPPPEDKCQVCARDIHPGAPHDATTLYYGTWFQMVHGRAPTWEDAMAECDEVTKAAWTAALTERGVDITSTHTRPTK